MRRTKADQYPQLVAVLGMHRSGTSLITRALQVVGVDLGDRLFPGAPDNPKGYWEDIDLHTLDCDMLQALDLDWDSLKPIQQHHVEALIEKGFLLRAVQLLRAKTEGRPIFGFKDPRLCKLLPFWNRVLSHLGLRTCFVIPVRHPLAVAYSLKTRNGIPFEKSLYLWIEHNINGLLYTSGETRVFVDYDIFLQFPERELQRISKTLGTGFNVDEFRVFQNDFIDRQLRHWHFHPEDAVLKSQVPGLAAEIYEVLQKEAAGLSPRDDLLSSKLPEWKARFDDLVPLLGLADSLDARYRQSLSQWEMREKAAENEYKDSIRRAQELTERLAQLESQLQAERRTHESLLEKAERRAQELLESIRGLEAELETTRKEAASTIRLLEARVTTVLRQNEKLQESVRRQHIQAKARRKFTEQRLRDLTLKLSSTQELLNAQQQRAFQDLRAAEDKLSLAHSEIAALRNSLESAEQAKTTLAATAQRQIQELTEQVERLQQELVQKDQDKEHSVAALLSELAKRENEIQDLTSELLHTRELLGATKQELEKQLAVSANLQHELALFATSTCWRVTKPLRILGDWLKRLHRNPSPEIQDLKLLRKSKYFQAEWYLKCNPDVAEANVDPAFHYYYQGAFEGRDPSPLFSSTWYLSSYPEVASKKLNPLAHYLRIGKKLGFRPRPDAKIPLSVIFSALLWVASHQRQDLPLLIRKFTKYVKLSGLTGLRDVVAQSVLSRRGKTQPEEPPTQEAPVALDHIRKAGNSGIEMASFMAGHEATSQEQPAGLSVLGVPAVQSPNTIESQSCCSPEDAVERWVADSEVPDLSRTDLPVKLIAFYLPQFHPIPENDAWWGKGFTEWRNVVQAAPLFPGHRQPNLPGELGFYDLRLPEIQERQVELARKAGIYGFCFYFYWFHGKRLLEKPLDQFASNPKINFPFCVCWANEPWTRRWDGYEGEVLMPLEHTLESDVAAFDAMIPYLRHPNYIRVEGRPLVLVYRAHFLSDPRTVAKMWRHRSQELGLPEPFLVACQTFGFFGEPESLGFDATCQFPVHAPIGIAELPDLSAHVRKHNPDFAGRVVEFSQVAHYYLCQLKDSKALFPGVMPGWDNTPRRKTNATIFLGSSPHNYKHWLQQAVQHALAALPESRRLVFVIAWNEWAESNYLEPDLRLGYANLKATAEALLEACNSLPGQWKLLFVAHDAQLAGAQLIALEVARWIREKTNVQVFTLLLGDGPLVEEFAKLSPVLTWKELQDLPQDRLKSKILDFVGGGVDLILGNTVVAGRVYEALSFLKAPVVTHVHELQSSIEFYAQGTAQQAFLHSSGFVACSRAVRDSLVSTFGVNRDAICTAHSFLTRSQLPALCPKQADKRRIRQQLGLREDAILVVGCGTGMAFRKGVDLFCELALMLGNKLGNSIHFYWIGSFDTSHEDPGFGQWGQRWAQLSAQGADKYVSFLGFHPDPLLILSACDIFALTSREDPFPLVMLEAAACGLPIVYFQGSGGASEFVGQDCGIGVPFGDLASMAQAIEALAMDAQARERKGLAAATRVKEQYLPQHQVPKLFAFCRTTAKKPPAVSVIVTNYNHARYLPKRLDSIFSQSFQDFEVIVIDDASTDESVAFLSSLESTSRVTMKFFKENSGSPFGRWAEAVSIATGDLVWIAEADDWCEPSFLSSLVPLFSDPGLSFAYTASFFCDESDSILGQYKDTPFLGEVGATKWDQSYTVSGQEEVASSLGIRNTVLNISSVVFRRSLADPAILTKIGTMRFAGDWLFLLSLAKSGRVAYISTPLNYHRRHPNSVFGRLLEGQATADEVIQFWSEHLEILEFVASHFSLPPTTWNTIAQDLGRLATRIRSDKWQARDLFSSLASNQLRLLLSKGGFHIPQPMPPT